MALHHGIFAETIAILAEFLGTTFFMFLAFFSLQSSGRPNNTSLASTPESDAAGQLVVALAWGTSYALSLAIFYRFSGGLFNPVLTLTMILSKRLPSVRAITLIPTQLLASISAAGLAKGLLPAHPQLASDVRLSPDLTSAQGLFIETFATFLLVSSVLAIRPCPSQKSLSTPLLLGLLLTAITIPFLTYTGASLNPFRAFAPAAVDNALTSVQWIYWLGPLLGLALALLLHFLLRQCERRIEELIVVTSAQGCAPHSGRRRSKQASLSGRIKSVHSRREKERDEEWAQSTDEEKEETPRPSLASTIPAPGSRSYPSAPVQITRPSAHLPSQPPYLNRPAFRPAPVMQSTRAPRSDASHLFPPVPPTSGPRSPHPLPGPRAQALAVREQREREERREREEKAESEGREREKMRLGMGGPHVVPALPLRYSYELGRRARAWSEGEGTEGPPSSWRGKMRGYEGASGTRVRKREDRLYGIR